MTLMKPLMVSCKEATYLMGLKEAGKLSLLNRVKLNLHTSLCTLCKRFETQTAYIGQAAADTSSDAQLPKDVEERLQQLLKEHQ